VLDQVEMHTTGDTGWEFPNYGMAVKHFYLEKTRGDPTTKRIVETRLLIRNGTTWHGYSYEWDAQGTDGTLLPAGKDKTYHVTVNGVDTTQVWHFPSRVECTRCHTTAAGHVIGITTQQLNGDFDYTPFAGHKANQLITLDGIGMFATPLAPATPATLPALPDPKDTTQSLQDRVKSYLHANCAHCHRPMGGAPVQIDFRYGTPLDQMKILTVNPEAGDLGLGPNAKLVVPHDPDNSIVYRRMARRDLKQMPPLGTNVVDDDGVKLVRDWINSLP
jgi:uncharacterized repeat protein (TIGR03806 family)